MSDRDAPNPRRSRSRRFLGCLFKGPLGCLAFFLGALVVFVLFLPAAGGRMIARLFTRRFDERHLGRLELNDVWLPSFYGPQRIDSLSLRDPEGDEILHAKVVAPPLGWSDGERWGPIDVSIDKLDLALDAQGTTNLARALAPRDPARPPDVFGVRVGPDGLTMGWRGLHFGAGRAPIAFVISVARLGWTDAHGRRVLIQDLEARGSLGIAGEHVRFELAGRGRLAEQASEGLSFRWSAPDLELLDEPERSPDWTFELELTGAPRALLEAACPALAALAPGLGDPVERVRLVLRGALARPRVEASLDDAGTHALLSGTLDRSGARIVGGPEDVARLEFPLDSWWTRTAFAELFPLAEQLELAVTDGTAGLELEQPELPLAGGLAGLSGRALLRSRGLTYELAPALGAELGSGRRPLPGLLELPIEAGRVRFVSFELPGPGGTIAASGSYDLGSRSFPSLILTRGGRSLELSGPRADPHVAPVPE